MYCGIMRIRWVIQNYLYFKNHHWRKQTFNDNEVRYPYLIFFNNTLDNSVSWIYFTLYEVYGLILCSDCLQEAVFVCESSNCFAYGTGNINWRRNVANAAVIGPRPAEGICCLYHAGTKKTISKTLLEAIVTAFCLWVIANIRFGHCGKHPFHKDSSQQCVNTFPLSNSMIYARGFLVPHFVSRSLLNSVFLSPLNGCTRCAGSVPFCYLFLWTITNTLFSLTFS